MVTKKRIWIEDVMGEGYETSYMYIALPMPIVDIRRMLDNIDISEETFTMDIIRYIIDPEYGPFTDSLMEVPSHVFVEGISPEEQVEGVLYTLTKWFSNIDFSEVKALIQEIMADAKVSGVDISPVSVKNLNSCTILEIGLTRNGP